MWNLVSYYYPISYGGVDKIAVMNYLSKDIHLKHCDSITPDGWIHKEVSDSCPAEFILMATQRVGRSKKVSRTRKATQGEMKPFNDIWRVNLQSSEIMQYFSLREQEKQFNSENGIE